MKEIRFLPDDPKLTAYALGELAGDDRAAVEAALREDPELRVIVDEIRATAGQLEAALSDEAILPASTNRVAPLGDVIAFNSPISAPTPTPPPRSRRRVAAPSTATPAKRVEANYPLPESRLRLFRVPQFYYVVGTAAAACFAVFTALRDPRPQVVLQPASEQKVYREIALTPPTSIAVSSLPPETNSDQPTEGVAASVASAVIDERAPVIGSGASTPPPVFLDRDLSLIGPVGGRGRPTLPPNSKSDTPLFTVTQSPQPRDAGADGVAHNAIGFDKAAGVSTLSGSLEPKDTPRPFADAPENETANAPSRGTLAPNVPAAGGESAAGGNGVSGTITFRAPGLVVTGPAVAVTNFGPVAPGSTLLPGMPITAAPKSGETVTLSAFMVSSDRGTGFAVLSDSQNPDSSKRGVAGRDYLPRPPLGAIFGRNTDAYAYVRDNEFLSVLHNPLSQFSVDVDTASYSNVRRIIQHGSPPPRDAVRIEEMLNYFPYRYPAPKGEVPFAAVLEVADAPWAPKHRLVRIGLKAREVPTAQRPAANLVFLLDVSSSMNQPNKLPLVKQSLQLLIGKLRADDRVAIVTYAGNSGLALRSTPVAQSREILNALDALTPVGAANGAMGIQLAYEVAEANFARDGVNRIILCTDGDFDVGVASEGDLVRLVERKANSGVYLTVLGFGLGNYKDMTLEKLADKGSGNYGYIDTLREAEKLLVEQVSSTLVTVAKDVKIQVEFNPARVSSYRLIGYENRLLRKEDFNHDKVDAGTVGAGHTVTAIYEIVPVGVEDTIADVPPVDELKYATRGAVSSRLEMPSSKRDPLINELLTVKVRFKKPDTFVSWPRSLEFPLLDAATSFAKASSDFRFAAAVAQFGMFLRGSPHRGNATLRDVAAWATAAAAPADDPGGYREEFIELVRRTQRMME